MTVLLALMLTAMVTVVVADSEAHWSSYCGHGATGYTDENGNNQDVLYKSWSNGLLYYHTHHRHHYTNGYYQHADDIQCPYNH